MGFQKIVPWCGNFRSNGVPVIAEDECGREARVLRWRVQRRADHATQRHGLVAADESMARWQAHQRLCTDMHVDVCVGLCMEQLGRKSDGKDDG